MTYLDRKFIVVATFSVEAEDEEQAKQKVQTALEFASGNRPIPPFNIVFSEKDDFMREALYEDNLARREFP